MNIKIKNKNGITLHTAGNYCKEDINLVLDESLIPRGTLEITENGEVDVTKYAKANVNIDTANKPEQSKSTVPTKNTQTILPDEGYVLNEVIVNPIPEEYIIPAGEFSVDENGSYDITEYASININVPIPEGYLIPEGTFAADIEGSYDVTPYAEAVFTVQKEQISVIPTEETQTLIPTENKFFDQVIVEPIPEAYLIPEGTLEISVEGVYDVTPYANVQVDVETEEVVVTPTEETQTFTPNENKFIDKVVINPIPEEYIIPEGTLDITKNGEYNVTDKASVNVNISGSGEDMLQTRVNVTKSCEYLFYNYDGTNVDFIKNLDTSQVTNMKDMFRTCKKLTTIPLLNTSSVTNMNNMFYGCTALTSIPLLNTSNVTNMSNIFYDCTALTSIPQLDTSSVTNMNNMFSGCSALTTIPQLDTSKVGGMTNMFYNCSALITIPQLNTSKVGNMYSMFYGCTALTSIPLLDVSKVTNITNMFKQCTSLKSILMYGMRVDFDISASTQFETEDLVIILNNLTTVAVTRTLTMGVTNLAKLSDEQKLIATNKGWTLA